MPNPFHWLTTAPPPSRRALLAASLGWALDSFDVMLYALVLATLIQDLHLSKASAGLLGSFTLLAAAAGGLLFGLLADRFGRTRALMASVLVYATFTAACGFAHTFAQLAVFRILLGFGMGGEWAAGAALVSETFPAEARGRALALMQSFWAVGYAFAALTVALILPRYGWRAVFFTGVLPALLTLYIRKAVPEPDRPVPEPDRPAPTASHKAGFAALFTPALRPLTLALTLMNAFCLFAYWGFNLWTPAYLSLPTAAGGIGLPASSMTAIVVAMQAGTWLGYLAFGFLADRFGRRPVYVAYLLAAALLVALFGQLHTALPLLLLAPCAAFAATGYYSGFAAVTADIYPPRIRATGQGFTYNLGRIASAAAPFLAGSVAARHGFGPAFLLSAASFLAAAACWLLLPETYPAHQGL